LARRDGSAAAVPSTSTRRPVPLERYRGAAECIEPILRYQDMDMYFRQDGEVYGLGSYWHEPRMLEPNDVPTKAFSENGVSVLPFQEDDMGGSVRGGAGAVARAEGRRAAVQDQRPAVVDAGRQPR
jgi:hypothetical protein